MISLVFISCNRHVACYGQPRATARRNLNAHGVTLA